MPQFNEYQKDIARRYLTTRDNISVDATPGSGKTTMLVGLAHKIKKPQSFCFLAFTKATQSVLQKRLPHMSGSIMTTYSLGFKNCYNYLDRPLTVAYNKTQNTFDSLINKNTYWSTLYTRTTGCTLADSLYNLKKQVCNLQSLSLLNCWTRVEDIFEYSQELNSSWGHEDEVLEWMSQLTHAITKHNYYLLINEGQIDFSEMVAWPAMWDDLIPMTFQEIFVDEFQDLSHAQQMLVHKSLAKGGQIVMVGDRRQAIYGFAGADHNSAENMTQLFDAITMPMPINYRCALEIIKHAQEIDGEIQARPGAPVGEVKDLNTQDAFSHLLQTKEETLVVARTNVALIKLALRLVALDKPFCFNRDVLLERLTGQIYKATSSNPPVDISQFKVWLGESKLFAKEKKASAMMDLLECLELFYNNYRPNSWSAFKRLLKRFFKKAETTSQVTLSTIHAAKGAEAHTVVFWGTNLVPHRMAVTESELVQETNLEYIARTRAIMRLYRVDTSEDT